jgi:hypothetical protein
MSGTGIGIAANDALNWYTSASAAVVGALDRSGNFQVIGGIGSSSASAGIGYTTGAGGTVTQATSRTTAVTLNKTSGAITLVSAANNTAAWTTFTVTNSSVAANDTVIVNFKSSTDTLVAYVSKVAAGSFNITFISVSGTTTEQPVINFNVIKGTAS